MVGVKRKHCGTDVPGPGHYKIPSLIGCESVDPTFTSSPCYSFGIRPVLKDSVITPGPIYDISGATKNGKITVPQAPLTSRHSAASAKRFVPAPGQYRPEAHLNAVFPKAPEYSIGRRLPWKGQFATPGPKYQPNIDSIKKSSPKFSMQGRTGDTTFGFKTPAPNQYGIPNMDMVKRRSPAYSLTSRRPPGKVSITPGPGAYNPEVKNILPRITSFKLNNLPNPCIKPYILPQDDEFNT